MRTLCVTGAFLLAGSFGAFAQLDLTPSTEKVSIEGVITRTEIRFKDGKKKIGYEAPQGWVPSGGGAKVSFTPVDVARCRLEISVTAGAKWPPFDTNGFDFYRKAALATVPPEAVDAKVEMENTDSVVIDEAPTLEVRLSYKLYSIGFTKVIWFLNRTEDQVQFSIVGPTDVFDDVYESARRSLYTWQRLP